MAIRLYNSRASLSSHRSNKLVSMHVEYARPWVLVSLGLLALDFIARLVKMRVRTATLTAESGGITKVEVEGVRSGWRAGQHVWIRQLNGRMVSESKSALLHLCASAECSELSKVPILRPSIFDCQLRRVRTNFAVSGSSLCLSGSIVKHDTLLQDYRPMDEVALLGSHSR